jgi:cytochrome c-type biogenesis protein CcmH
MTISIFQPATRFIGTIAVIAVMAVIGWSQNAAAAPAADAPAVKLSPAIASKAAPNDVVYVFARAVNGPRMPLAIVRKQVKDLPATIVLEDSQGMGQGMMTLSTAPEVVVVARVSKSGMANAQNGDLEGMSAPVKKGTKSISVSIDKVLAGQKDMMAPHGKTQM